MKEHKHLKVEHLIEEVSIEFVVVFEYTDEWIRGGEYYERLLEREYLGHRVDSIKYWNGKKWVDGSDEGALIEIVYHYIERNLEDLYDNNLN